MIKRIYDYSVLHSNFILYDTFYWFQSRASTKGVTSIKIVRGTRDQNPTSFCVHMHDVCNACGKGEGVQLLNQTHHFDIPLHPGFNELTLKNLGIQ